MSGKKRNVMLFVLLFTLLLGVIVPVQAQSYGGTKIIEYSCAMKSHFRKFGNQMSGSGNHLCNYASLLA